MRAAIEVGADDASAASDDGPATRNDDAADGAATGPDDDAGRAADDVGVDRAGGGRDDAARIVEGRAAGDRVDAAAVIDDPRRVRPRAANGLPRRSTTTGVATTRAECASPNDAASGMRGGTVRTAGTALRRAAASGPSGRRERTGAASPADRKTTGVVNRRHGADQPTSPRPGTDPFTRPPLSTTTDRTRCPCRSPRRSRGRPGPPPPGGPGPSRASTPTARPRSA